MDMIHVFGVSILIVHERTRGDLFAMYGRVWTLLAHVVDAMPMRSNTGYAVCHDAPAFSAQQSSKDALLVFPKSTMPAILSIDETEAQRDRHAGAPTS